MPHFCEAWRPQGVIVGGECDGRAIRNRALYIVLIAIATSQPVRSLWKNVELLLAREILGCALLPLHIHIRESWSGRSPSHHSHVIWITRPLLLYHDINIWTPSLHVEHTINKKPKCHVPASLSLLFALNCMVLLSMGMYQFEI